jgi:hypothetical protein
MSSNEQRVTGWWIFAGALLAIGGFVSIVWGIAAIGDSKFFTENATFVFSNLKTWGWITLIIGVIQLFAAVSLFNGGGFGRWIGMFAAALAAFDALLTTGTTPFWSLCVFALAIVVLFQLAKPSDSSTIA